MVNIIVIESLENDIVEQINDARQRGFIVFVKHDVDPDYELMPEPFLHYLSNQELYEKADLLKADITAGDVLRW